MIFSRKGGGRRDERARAHWMAEISTGWRDPSAREPEPLEVPEFGPYDAAVAPDDGVPRVDLGSLRVPNLPDTPVQVEAAPNGQIVRVQLEHQGSRLQLAAFAAPRTEGIWDEVRDEVRRALLSNGAKVVEVDSDYGPALAARQGGTGGKPVIETRHLGIDGPRWFVHAVFIGPAAVDPSYAPALWTALRGLVVNRGNEARPVREPLPLQLPPELAARLAEMAARQAAAQASGQAAAQASGQAAAQASGPAAAQRAAQGQPASVAPAETATGAPTTAAEVAPAKAAPAKAVPAKPAPAKAAPGKVAPAKAVPAKAAPTADEAASASSAADRTAATSPRGPRKATGRSGSRGRSSR